MRRLLSSLFVFAAFLAAVLGVPGRAEAQGLYIGGAYSWASQTSDGSGFDQEVFEGDASGYKVMAGLDFGHFFGVEGAYTNFGTYDALDLEGFDESPGEAASDGWGLALTARLPLGRTLTLYGKAGYFFWDASVSGTEDFLEQWGDAASSGQDPYYGAGLLLNFGKVGVFGEYERYQMDDFDFDLVNLGVRLTF